MGFVRNHATTTKLRLHSYGIDGSLSSVIQSREQQNVSDHLGSHTFGFVVWRMVDHFLMH